MSILQLPVLNPPQGWLWESSCPDCVYWNDCGGSPAAPCGCSRKPPEGRFRCGNCDIGCKERGLKTGDPNDTFEVHAREGLSLELLQLEQPPAFSLPPFIPIRTELLRPEEPLKLSWAGISAKTLFTRHRHAAVQARPFLSDPAATRRALALAPATRLLVVLNGRDDMLEGFWAAEHEQLFAKLKAAGVEAVTGPTFSVTGEHRTPASHNVMMLLRHHRVVEAIHESGLIAIPNLYWRNERDRFRWIDWLGANPQVHAISRDFSRTKQWAPFRREFAGLLEILRGVGRPLHVVLVGVGAWKAEESFQNLGALGGSATIVAAGPIMRGIKHGEYIELERGSKPRLIPSPQSRQDTAELNLMAMRRFTDELTAEARKVTSDDSGGCEPSRNSPSERGAA